MTETAFGLRRRERIACSRLLKKLFGEHIFCEIHLYARVYLRRALELKLLEVCEKGLAPLS